MLGNHAEFGIFRKEWVARRWLVVICAVLVVGFWLELPEWLGGATVLVGMLLGAGWLAPEEQEPERAWLGSLPISRQRVLGDKFAVTLFFDSILQGLACLLYTHPYVLSDKTDWLNLPPGAIPFPLINFLVILSSLPAMVLAMIVALHARSYITTVALTGVIGLVPGALLAANIALPWRANIVDFETVVRPLAGLLILMTLLVGWLWFVWCKTRLRELSARARSGALLLFMVSLWEISFLLFSTGWRNLWFILTGH